MRDTEVRHRHKNRCETDGRHRSKTHTKTSRLGGLMKMNLGSGWRPDFLMLFTPLISTSNTHRSPDLLMSDTDFLLDGEVSDMSCLHQTWATWHKHGEAGAHGGSWHTQGGTWCTHTRGNLVHIRENLAHTHTHTLGNLAYRGNL